MRAQTIRFKEVSVLPKVQSWPPVFCKTVKGTNIIIFFSMYEYNDDAVHLFFLLISVITKFLETSLTEIIKCSLSQRTRFSENLRNERKVVT